MVVVETSRGWQLGEVTGTITDTFQHARRRMGKQIDRKATPKILLQRQNWQQKEGDVVSAAQKRSKELNLRGVKFVNVSNTLSKEAGFPSNSAPRAKKVDLINALGYAENVSAFSCGSSAGGTQGCSQMYGGDGCMRFGNPLLYKSFEQNSARSPFAWPKSNLYC